jgi:hypothetical protein
MSTDEKLSRRTWLRKTVLFTAAIGAPSLLGSPASSSQGKASKSVVHYRDYPKGMQMCGMCKLFEGSGMMSDGMMGRGMMAGGMMGGGMMGGGMMDRGMMAGECEVVEGRISPMGWCDLYAPRRG